MNGYAEDGDYIVDTWLLDTDFSFEFGEHQDLPKLNKEQLRFILAVKAGKIKYVAAKIAEGFDVNFCTAWRGNPLCTAIENSRLDIAKLLLDSGAHTENALHLACLRSNIDLVSMLLSYGANPNAVGHGVGEDIPACFIFALHVAQPLTIVLKLIEAGADVNAMCCQTLWTPLHLVCNSPAHSADIVQAILRAGGMAHHRDKHTGWTPLQHAAMRSDRKIIQLLIEAGYPIHREVMPLKDLHPSLLSDLELMTFLKQAWSNPYSLKKLCAALIRKCLGGCKMQDKVLQLPLPKYLMKYVALEVLL